MNFYEKFNYLCSKEGVAPSTACRQMGMSPSAVQRWKDDTMPTKSSLFRIAEFFNYSPSKFVEYAFGDELECNLPKTSPKKTTGVGELGALVSIARILEDPVFAKYLEIVSNCTPEQKEFLTQVMTELRDASTNY